MTPHEPVAARRAPLSRPDTRDGIQTVLPPAARFILRGRSGAIAAVGASFGLDMPREACRAATVAGRATLWLGPIEWLLLAPADEGGTLVVALERAMEGQPHSLVDVSHRQTAFEVIGPHVEAVLNAGCPLDLDKSAFPVGMCTRTVLGKSEIVLWRTADATFRVEVFRSFAPYVWQFLDEASREFHACPASMDSEFRVAY